MCECSPCCAPCLSHVVCKKICHEDLQPNEECDLGRVSKDVPKLDMIQWNMAMDCCGLFMGITGIMSFLDYCAHKRVCFLVAGAHTLPHGHCAVANCVLVSSCWQIQARTSSRASTVLRPGNKIAFQLGLCLRQCFLCVQVRRIDWEYRSVRGDSDLNITVSESALSTSWCVPFASVRARLKPEISTARS